MIARPCDDHISGCPCVSDDPFANLSSEAPDPVDVIRMAWTANNPPINSPENFWGTLIGVGGCSGPDITTAQDCAKRASNHEATEGQPSFGNATTGCTVACPDGSLFSFFVAPNTFTATSQAEADAVAASYCRYRAQQLRTCAPAVVTGAASNLSGTNARMNGTVNPNGASTSVFFEWGLTTAYGHLTPVTSVGSGNVTLPFLADVTGLPSGTIHYRIVAISSQGTSRGADVTFSTASVTIQVVANFSSVYDLSDDGIVAGIDIFGLGAYWKAGVTTQLDFGGGAGVIECANNGRVGGTSFDGAFNAQGLWDVVGSLPINIGMVDSEIQSINASGVGAVQGPASVAYRYVNGVGFTNLGNLGTDSRIGSAGVGAGPFKNRTINAAGQIALSSRDAAGIPKSHACRWFGGVLTNITPPFAGIDESWSTAINAAGHIAGTYWLLTGQVRGFFYNGAVHTDFAIGIDANLVYWLNDNDQVCGVYTAAGQYHAMRWNATDGAVAIAEIPGTIASEALSLNNDGWIVGHMNNGLTDTAFIYKDATVTALHTLLPAATDWDSLEIAYFVNNNKQIVGYGTYLGAPGTWFLMTLP